jgi:predicted RecB family nuclease
MTLPELTGVRGIGVDTAQLLAEHGIRDVATLAAAKIEEITAVPGFGPARAAAVKAAAAELLAETGKGVETAAEPASSGKATKKKDKKKKAEKKAKGKKGKKKSRKKKKK